MNARMLTVSACATAGVLALVLAACAPKSGSGGPSATTAAHVIAYSAEQAQAGEVVFRANCAICHGADLEGGDGPPLSGKGFVHHWANGRRPLGDLQFIITDMMPLQAPGSLSTTEYTDIVAYILSRNGYPAGSTPLGPATLTAVFAQPGQAAGEATVPPQHLLATPATAGKAISTGPTDAELLQNADANWLMYNKDYRGQRYSGLAQITADNARKLTPTCAFQAGETGAFEASPVVYDGMMYITTPFNTFALDPRTCRKIWQDTRFADVSTPVVLTRGVALYQGRIFRSTPDGHLVALDAKTGKLLWNVWVADADRGYWMSGAPVAYRGKVYVGEAGADWGSNSHVHAFDTETGRRIWTFDIIPTGDQPGAETWKQGSEHGGGSVWSTFTITPEDGRLYVSTGNPAPDYDGPAREGTNLYTDAVVALDAETGKLAWYVQQNPHDLHDWDTADAAVVFDQGDRHYLAVADKGGWLSLYDRSTRERLAHPEVSDHLNIDVPITPEGVHVCPGNIGGVEWNGPAYSPKDKLLFVNSVHWCGVFKASPSRFVEGESYFGGSITWDDASTAKGWTRAFDAATGKPRWEFDSPTPMLAALTPTAGGVVFTGDLNGDFLALASATGKILYRFNTGGAIAGAASTYLVDGKQYVAITSGNASRSVWHTTGAATVFVFALPPAG